MASAQALALASATLTVNDRAGSAHHVRAQNYGVGPLRARIASPEMSSGARVRLETSAQRFEGAVEVCN